MDADKDTIYVIDDDAAVRDVIMRILRSAGWVVECYGAAHEFLLKTPFAHIGCILLDMSMPQMTGPELHDELRTRKCSLPVIYLTGHSTVSIGVDAMRQGAFDFIEKPFDINTLLQVVDKAVVQRRLAAAKES